MKCRECKNYKPLDEKSGDCFGAVVQGDRHPRESPKCKGEFFKAKLELNINDT